MNYQKTLPSISQIHDALKNYRESIGKPTDSRHYINEVRLIRFAVTGRTKYECDIKPVTRTQRKLYKRIIDMNRQLISEGVNYQLRKQVCRQMVENHKSKSST